MNIASKAESLPVSRGGRWWNDRGVRRIAIQIVTFALVLLGIFYLITNTAANLRRLGIPLGFDFLSDSAGFPVSISLIPVELSSSIARLLLVGILNTFLVSIIGIVFATIVGFMVGIMRLSKNPLIALLGTIYVESLRNIPLLLQIVFWYFGVLATLPNVRQSWSFFNIIDLNQRGLFLPRPVPTSHFLLGLVSFLAAVIAGILLSRWAKRRQIATGKQFPVYRTSVLVLIGVPAITALLFGSPLDWDYPELQGFNFHGGMVLLPELLALCLAIILYHAAFIAENVRSGLLSVSKGQWEAALSLALDRAKTMRLIVLPQALRVIVPPLGSQFLNVVKNSTLAVAIGYPDMVSIFAGTVLNQTGRAIECISITMLFYLCVSLAISGFTNWFNRRIQVVER